MADFNRRFKKITILNLIEGDVNNSNPDGNLNLDSPEFVLTSWTVDAMKKTLRITILFNADQGSLMQNHSRTFEIDLTTVNASVRTRFKDNYNFITDSITKALPELADGTEI